MKKTIKSLPVFLAVAALTACGGSDDNTPAADTNTPTETVGSSSQADRFGAAQYIQAQCGSAVVSEIEANNSLSTSFALGEVVKGQLIKDSTVLNYDLWNVTLEAGNYHLVIDSQTQSDSFESIGLNITTSTPEGGERIIRKLDSAYGTRAYEFLELDVAQTMSLKLEPVWEDTMNYQMAIFANGEAVPSHRLSACTPETVMGLGETQSVVMTETDSRDDYRWYRLNLDAGVYNLDVTVSGAENDTKNVQFDLYERFGDVDDHETRIHFNVNSDAVWSSSDEFSVRDNNDVWIRVSSSRGSYDLEFTVTQ